MIVFPAFILSSSPRCVVTWSPRRKESEHKTENAPAMQKKLKEAYVARDALAKELSVSAKELREMTAVSNIFCVVQVESTSHMEYS